MATDQELPPPKRKAEKSEDTLDPRHLLKVLTAYRRVDSSVRMPSDLTGLAGKISDTLNEIIELNERSARELERVSNTVGKDGRLTQRANIPGTTGEWCVYQDTVNSL